MLHASKITSFLRELGITYLLKILFQFFSETYFTSTISTSSWPSNQYWVNQNL